MLLLLVVVLLLTLGGCLAREEHTFFGAYHFPWILSFKGNRHFSYRMKSKDKRYNQVPDLLAAPVLCPPWAVVRKPPAVVCPWLNCPRPAWKHASPSGPSSPEVLIADDMSWVIWASLAPGPQGLHFFMGRRCNSSLGPYPHCAAV